MKNILEIYEELKEANLTETQTRAMISGMQALVEDRVSELATKSDLDHGLRELETKLELKILTLEVKLESGRVDTLKWMATLLTGGITIVLGAMYFMFAVFLKH